MQMAEGALHTLDGKIPTTHWSIVQAVAAEGPERQEALERFARNYWPAIYAFARKKGHRPADAEDLTQRFLVELISGDAFSNLSAERGRFRSWLLACLHNFLRKDWRDQNCAKRGGGKQPVSIDRDLGEAWLEHSASDEASPDLVFDRRWAAGILERAIGNLARSYQRDGKSEAFRALAPTITGAGEPQSYLEIGRELGISESNARVAAFRMRKRLRRLIREEVAITVGSTDEIDEEIDQLFAVLGGGGSISEKSV